MTRRLRWIGLASTAAIACLAATLWLRAHVRLAPPLRAVAEAPPPASFPTPFSVPSRALPPRAALPLGTLRVLVLGDSVATFLGVAMRYRQDEARAFVAERGVGECSIFAPKMRWVDGDLVTSTSCSASWVDDVEELAPDVTLIVLGGAFLGKQACDADWLDAYRQRVVWLVEAMGKNAGRVVIAKVPYPLGPWRHSNMLERVDCFDGMLVKAAAEARVGVLDLMEHVCPTQACVVESQGKPIRPDGLHFDGVGTEETARWTLGELRRLVREPIVARP